MKHYPSSEHQQPTDQATQSSAKSHDRLNRWPALPAASSKCDLRERASCHWTGQEGNDHPPAHDKSGEQPRYTRHPERSPTSGKQLHRVGTVCLGAPLTDTDRTQLPHRERAGTTGTDRLTTLAATQRRYHLGMKRTTRLYFCFSRRCQVGSRRHVSRVNLPHPAVTGFPFYGIFHDRSQSQPAFGVRRGTIDHLPIQFFCPSSFAAGCCFPGLSQQLR